MPGENDRPEGTEVDPYATPPTAGEAERDPAAAGEAAADGTAGHGETIEGSASAVGAVVDDLDEPENPDEATRAEAEAAREALASTAPRRRYRGPQSILIMLLVVGLLMATGIYAVVWFQKMKVQDDRADLRALEEREAMALFQQRSTELKQAMVPPGTKLLPPGFVYRPLSAGEREQMLQLRAVHGPQFRPDDKQNMLITEVREMEAARGLPVTALPSAAGTGGAGTGTVAPATSAPPPAAAQPSAPATQP